MLNAWPRIIMFRRLRDGNPCLKGQLKDLKLGKMTFWKWLSEPKSEEEEEKEKKKAEEKGGGEGEE
jgi:hypothetical protein